MKTRLVVFLALFSGVCFAQAPYPGNDSDHGVTTGGFPNPYTGNVSFSTRDLVVAGAVGQYGLSWQRYATSRTSQAQGLFGLGHNWTHNWQWEIADAGKDSRGRAVVSVREPYGTIHRFTETASGQWSSAPAVRDRLVSDGDAFFLQRRGGAQARFSRERTELGNVFTLRELVDDRGNVWKLTYTSGRLAQITEPAGRWLKIAYKTLSVQKSVRNIRPFTLVSSVTASDGQKVIYIYRVPAEANYPVLAKVVYPDEGVGTYAYAAPRAGTRLLLTAADDPRGDRSLRGRVFHYRSEVDAAVGQVLEVSAEGGAVVQALSADSRDPRSYAMKRFNGATVFRTYNPGGNIAETINALGFSRKYEYDANGRGSVISASDELDHVTRYEYGSAGDLTRIIHPLKSAYSWQRDAHGRVLVETDEMGHSRTIARDSKGRVTKVQHPEGTTEEMTYNEFGQLLSKKDRGSGVTTFEHDARGLRTRVTDALGSVIRTTYDASDRMASVTDPLGNTTRFERDAAGRIVKTIYPDGASNSVMLDRFGQVTKRIDSSGTARAMGYDSLGRLTSSSDAEGSDTRYVYAPIGQIGASLDRPIKRVSPSGQSTVTALDAEGRVIAITVAAGTPSAVSTRFGYDAQGRQTSITNPAGRTAKYFYDERGRRIKSMTALDHATTYTYDAAGRKLSETDAKGNTTRWTYDEAGREVTKTDAKGQINRRLYHPSGLLAALVDPKGNAYRYEYDALGRQVALVYPDDSRELTTYDGAGRRQTYTNRAGTIRRFVYDSRNREVSSEWNDGSERIVKSYDGAGRLTVLENGASKLSYTYDKNGRVISETQNISASATGGALDPVPRTVRYTYTADGDRESLMYPDGSHVVLTYNPRNQLLEIAADGEPPPIASYEYDLAGNATRMPRENLTESTRDYDAESQVTRIVERGPHRNPLSKLDYAYDEAGNPIASIETMGSEVGRHAFQYDATYQLTGATHTRPVSARQVGMPTSKVRLAFDAAGNRLQVNTDGLVVRYAVNNLNQYEQVGDFAPAYDGNGNLASLGEWLYRYDALNRLIGASNGKMTARFYYDAKNRVVTRSYNGRLALNTYDNWSVIEERDSSEQQQARYVHGRRVDEIVAMVNRAGVFYPHHDALGSVTMLTDTDGQVVERYTYAPSGEVQVMDAAATIREASAVGNRWMFTGREWLPEIGLYDYRNRMYSAKLGRFMQSDPIRFSAGDINIYRYVNNNPTRFTDWNGLELRVYSSDAFGIPGANHAFVWSTTENDGVGRSGSSGYERGAGYPSGFNPATTGYDYNVVTDLNGWSEREVINQIGDHSSLNDGMWVPYYNDCHTDLADAFGYLGIDDPGAPNASFDLDNWFVDSINTALYDFFYDFIYDWFSE